jgi:hypothetical protein
VVVVDKAIFVAVLWQTVSLAGVAVTTEVGSTVTSRLKGVPGQSVEAGPVGVITYLTTPDDVPVLSKVWFMVVPQAARQSLKPVIIPPVGDINTEAVQV